MLRKTKQPSTPQWDLESVVAKNGSSQHDCVANTEHGVCLMDSPFIRHQDNLRLAYTALKPPGQRLYVNSSIMV